MESLRHLCYPGRATGFVPNTTKYCNHTELQGFRNDIETLVNLAAVDAIYELSIKARGREYLLVQDSLIKIITNRFC